MLLPPYVSYRLIMLDNPGGEYIIGHVELSKKRGTGLATGAIYGTLIPHIDYWNNTSMIRWNNCGSTSWSSVTNSLLSKRVYPLQNHHISARICYLFSNNTILDDAVACLWELPIHNLLYHSDQKFLQKCSWNHCLVLIKTRKNITTALSKGNNSTALAPAATNPDALTGRNLSTSMCGSPSTLAS